MYDINFFFFLNLVVSGKRYIAANEIRIKLSPCWSCIAHPFFSVMLLKDIRFFYLSNSLKKSKRTYLKSTISSFGQQCFGRKKWVACNLEDSSVVYWFRSPLQAIVWFISKACLAPCAIYAAFNYLYLLEPVIYISSCLTTHRMTSAYESWKSGASYTQDVELAMQAGFLLRKK